MSDILLKVEHLTKHYPILSGMFKRQTGTVYALNDVSFTLKRGETLGIVGESGCGKTTLGKCIIRLHPPTSGDIFYNFGRERDDDFRNLLKLKGRESFMARRKLQFIFQDPYSSFNPSKTIFQSMDEPLRIHTKLNAAMREELISELLRTVNLPAQYMYRYPHEFSGGQRQRICIARALSINPSLIICDEPVSALDVSVQAQVLNLMKDLQESKNLSYIFIAHDLSVVQYMSDRILVMYLGGVVEESTSEELYRQPLHPYTQSLLSAVPIPVYDADKPKRIILQGDVPSPSSPPSGCKFHPRCRFCQEICRQKQPELKTVSEGHRVACHLAQ